MKPMSVAETMAEERRKLLEQGQDVAARMKLEAEAARAARDEHIDRVQQAEGIIPAQGDKSLGRGAPKPKTD